MEPDLGRKIEDFHKSITTAGEAIIFNKFPNKIIELQKLVQTTRSPDSPFHPSHVERFTDTTAYPPPRPASANGPALKKRKRDDETSPPDTTPSLGTGPSDTHTPGLQSHVVSNKHMQKVHSIVKSECEQLASMIDEVKLWVTLTMPKIEDGDNFGVQIQEEVLAELHRAQESAFNLRDAGRQDYLSRAKICSKIIKYPNLEDYPLSLKEHDEKQLYLARQHLTDLRNMYAVLTDLIHKNITKIRTPKANNSVGLY